MLTNGFERSNAPCSTPSWSPVRSSDVDSWNSRLQSTKATYRQYPYWTESYCHRGIIPRYLIYGPDSNAPDAFACILTFRYFGMLIGLLHHGPVLLNDDGSVDTAMVQKLTEWAKQEGYIFLRATNSDVNVINCIKSSVRFDEVNAFPGLGDARNAGLIEQIEDDDEMLKTFQPICRREIKAARNAGYEIHSADSPQALEDAWPMFVSHAELKGFRVAPRPYSELLEVFRRAQPHRLARLYTAYLQGRAVQSIVIIRHGSTAELLLAATNIENLGSEVSPSCLLHWHAMRDLYGEGCQVYNISGPGDGTKSKVGQFKKKFRPVFVLHPGPLTIVINPFVYRLWRTSFFRIFIPLRGRYRKLLGTRESARKTIREVVSARS